MQDFFGWKNASMCKEYISTSKASIATMAAKLGAYSEGFNMGDPDLEVEVAAEPPNPGATAMAAVVETAAAMAEEDMDNFDMEMDEDPEMYVAAGIPPPMSADSADRIESAVKSAISSLPNMQSANLTVKVVINRGNNVIMNF